jgi:protein-tyrosine-phosphatase
MRKLVDERVEGADKIAIVSAGLATDAWLKRKGPKKEFPLAPSSGTRRLLEQKGIDYDYFSKQQLDRATVEPANIIFVMTRREKRVLLERFPQAEDKVFVLREYAGYDKHDWNIPTPRTFNYQTTYLFEEALKRVLRRLGGETLDSVRRVPKKPFRGRPYEEAA